MIKLISSYLTERNFSVRINDTYSSHRPTEAGVAQGTLISPLLFNIYVNDIPKHDNAILCMFADDTAILATHTEPKLIARALNRHILDLEDWFSKWKIALNVAKTEAVFFTRKRSLTYPKIYLHNEQIPWSQHTKYLGVILDKKLTFKQHITHIRGNFIKKAHTLSPLINRRSKLNRSNKLLIYSLLLRPIIVYAAPESSDDRTDTGRLRSQRRYPFGDRSPPINTTSNQRAPSHTREKARTSLIYTPTKHITTSCYPNGQATIQPKATIG
ncbi:RNA-directed DNA polymerase from mobile element jockey [Trichonephila clavipes]|nr:RNA-directed DNA polymerase from mobile element jockey [Trichonephila clavipes]